MQNKKYLTVKERIAFTVGAFGRSGIYTIMSMFSLVFFQNGAGLTLEQGTTIILCGRIFDAINDPVMGMLVDKTKSKWGKMRPYLLFAPVPIAICTILLFTAPFENGSSAAFAWAMFTYILWGVAFTIQDVPFWGLSSVITPLESERTSFISTARLGSTFGGILPALLVPILYQSNLGYTKGFFVAGVIFAVIGSGLSILIFFVSKERVPKADKAPTFKETLTVLKKDKVLIIVILAALLGSTMVMANQCADYIGNYLIIQNYTDFAKIFSDAAGTSVIANVDAAAAYDFWIPRGTIVTTLTVAIGVGMVPAMTIFPLLRKKFSLKQIYIGSALFGLVVHALCYIVFSGNITNINIYVLWIFLFLMGLPLGIYNVITYTLIADAVDYMEWKTGERHEGVCFSFQTFLSKVNAGIATAVFGQILGKTDFRAVDKALVDNMGRQIFFQQSEPTQKILLALVTLVPAVGFLLTVVPMLFNDYTGKKKEQAIAEITAKRTAADDQKSAKKAN
ncbi:MAG: MFS transporter [Oscillospiraceae bacterium]|nr:MFS transporter [Oscillospiraceae bacterium]